MAKQGWWTKSYIYTHCCHNDDERRAVRGMRNISSVFDTVNETSKECMYDSFYDVIYIVSYELSVNQEHIDYGQHPIYAPSSVHAMKRWIGRWKYLINGKSLCDY